MLTLIFVSQLDNLPENSPINIVQTPIPITTSVPKRAKSQRKKALAAALATAQEYSEISMEQKKLKVCSFGFTLNSLNVSPWFIKSDPQHLYLLSFLSSCICPFFFHARQEAFTKAAGKKSKTSVELDLGDMLAALEKEQKAMKAKQLTNTKPLSFTGIHWFDKWKYTFFCKVNVVMIAWKYAKKYIIGLTTWFV